MAVVGDILKTPEQGWKRYEHNNVNGVGFGYTGHLTVVTNQTMYSGGSLLCVGTGCNANKLNSSVVYARFTGKKFRIIAYQNSTYNDRMIVEIDGVKHKWSCKSVEKEKTFVLVYTTEELDDCEHFVKIYADDLLENYDDNKHRWSVDAIDVDENAEWLPTIGHQFSSVKNGYNRYPSGSYHLTKNTDWKNESSFPFATYTTINNAESELYFFGKEIILLGRPYTNCTYNFELYVDETLVGNFTEYLYTSSTNLHYSIVAMWSDLSSVNKIHKLKIVNLSSSKLVLTYFDVKEGFLCTPNGKYIDVTPIQTEANQPSEVKYSSFLNNGTTHRYAWSAFAGMNRDTSPYYSWSTANNTFPQYVDIKFPKKEKINAFMVSNRALTGASEVKEFEILGSDDYANWKSLGTFNRENDMIPYELFYYDLKETYKYTWYRFNILSCRYPDYYTNSQVGYTIIGQIRFLLNKDTVCYLMKDNDKYKYKDEIDGVLKEVDLSDVRNTTDVYNCKGFYSISNAVESLPNNNIKIVSFKNKKISVDGVVGNNGVITFNYDYYITSAKNIKKIFSQYNIAEDCNIKFVVSDNSGNTWKSYNADSWIVVSGLNRNNIVNSFNIINQNGTDITTIEKVDFNSLGAKKVLFAISLSRDTNDKEVSISNIQWNYDEKGRLSELDSSECKKEIFDNTLLIKPQNNYDKLYVNISTNGGGN